MNGEQTVYAAILTVFGGFALFLLWTLFKYIMSKVTRK